MVASSIAITVNSGSGNHWFCAMLIPVKKYVTVCRRDANSGLLFGATKVYFESGREKEIWRGRFYVYFEVFGCNEYQENSPFIFCVCIQVFAVSRPWSSEFN